MANSFWGHLVLGSALAVGIAACDATTTTRGAAGVGGYTGSTVSSAGGKSTAGGAANTGGASAASTSGQIAATACTSAFGACGGDLTGTWKISQLCTQGDVAQYFNDQMSQEYSSACSSVYQSVTVSAAGSVTYGNGSYTPNVTMVISMDVLMTSACFSAIAGQTVTLTSSLCSTYATQTEVETPGATAVCAFDGNNCNCAMTVVQSPTGGDTYTTSGSTISWSDGTTSGYCIQGNTMTESDPIGGSAFIVMTTAKQ